MQTVSLMSNPTAYPAGAVPQFAAQRPVKTPSSPNKVDALHLTRVRFGSDSVQGSAASAQPTRTRWTVFKDLSKRYFQTGIWGSLFWGAVIGGVIALGSPVFVVTFPATVAVLMTIALGRRALFAKNNDPNGEAVNKIYKLWDEVDKAGGVFKFIQAKAQEAQEKRENKEKA
jgi:hypothetical protein